LLFAGTVQAGGLTGVETVYVGNAGNPGELSGVGAGGFGYDVIAGGVDYGYRMGKFEITAGQYTQFLNAVARFDRYRLYSEWMSVSTGACDIRRSGAPGSYTYTVSPEWVNRPVNYVSWGDAARYANWLHNGQPTGSQGLSTTEDGSYYLNGATSNIALASIVREPDATWVIPTENEWYKSAYHMNDGATANYYDYPMRSSALPDNGNPDGDSGNSANFWDGDYTVGSPYYTTEVGLFASSESPYGTFDQGGNVWEWNETPIEGSWYRGLRGGAFSESSFGLVGAVGWLDGKNYFYDYAVGDSAGVGFRVALVPESRTATVMLILGLELMVRRRTLCR
jgi:formylglycine-generating enzyme required for sulfatase activity